MLADDVMDAISKGDISLKTIDQDILKKISLRNDELGHIAHSLDKLIKNQDKQAHSAKAIASGDLTIQPHIAGPDDILGQSFMTMVEQLKKVLNSVNISSEKVLAATEKMYEGSKVLTAGAKTQAEAVESVASALNKMEEQVEITTQASMDVRENARETVSHADEGQLKMSELKASIDNLNHTGKKISDIMNNITNIASQTNLIALNAAIEAARAGEHGRGFAVVADEVRKLASLTAEAAEDSNHLIAETLSQMETGKTLADATSETFHMIVDKINFSASELEKVTESHVEQNKTANDLHDAITRIEVVAKDNLTISRKTIEENNILTSMSEELVKTAAYFSNTGSKSGR
jgi:methyl-accepting chemotaxis protein